MYQFNVSAPGRVFLHGEPVRPDKLCIAASLNMRTKLTFTSLPTAAVRSDFIMIDFSSINLRMKIPLQTFIKHFYGENANRALTDVQLHSAVRDFVSGMRKYKGTYEPSSQIHCLSLQAFFFLFVRIAYDTHIQLVSSFIVKVSTELAIGEGLGSSASFAVCLAACFLRWSLLQKGIVCNRQFDAQEFLDIMKYARSSDFIIFNASTEIDAMISVYGLVQLFQGGIYEDVVSEVSDMKILLVFSNISQKMTIHQNTQLEIMTHSYQYVNYILDSIDAITVMSTDILHEIDRKVFNLINTDIMAASYKNLFHLAPLDCCKILTRLIHINQALLSALGMTHPNVDIICSIARDFSLAGKLTSNGAGGYAFILLLPNSTDEFVKNLLNILKSHNFPVKIASLNCNGVTIE